MKNAKRFSWRCVTPMRKIWYLLASFALLIGLIVASVEFVVFDMGFYRQEYQKLERYEEIGIAKEDLLDGTKHLLAFVRDERKDLDLTYQIQGVVRPLFNEREITHMEDVRDLYLKARMMRRIGLSFFLATLIYAIYKYKKLGLKELSRSILQAMGVMFALILVLGIFYMVDFERFWTIFHELSFSNDLWILDSRTDILIQMVPEQFFIDCVGRIIQYSILSFAVIFVAAMAGVRMKIKELVS